MKKALKTVDAYIAAAPKEARAKLKQLRRIIKTAAPKATESISYGIPYYAYHGRLLYIAGYTTHLSMYPLTAAMKTQVPAVKKYASGKATIHFSLDTPLPVGMIKRLIAVRVKENEKKAKKKLE